MPTRERAITRRGLLDRNVGLTLALSCSAVAQRRVPARAEFVRGVRRQNHNDQGMECHGRDGCRRWRFLPDALSVAVCRWISTHFWLVKALWKSFQSMYSPRIQQLEKAFASGEFADIAPFRVYTSWFAALQEQGFGIFDNFRFPIVAFPHLITLAAGVILFTPRAFGLVALSPKG